MDTGHVGVLIVSLFWLVPFAIAIWAIVSVVRALTRMAEAQEASAHALRHIADDIVAVARR